MTPVQFQKIKHLRGLKFIKELLRVEERNFKKKNFLKGSTFEDINVDFGIFPIAPVYPVYFSGNIREPKGKFIFIGINPGYKDANNKKEQAFLEKHGSFEGYCRLYGDFRFKRKGLLPYFANIAGFLRRYYNISEKIDWNWFQKNFINLELIPYHSVNASGLRINNTRKYREVYFEIILKILKYLNPKKPIFINGFPTMRYFIEDKKNKILPEFKDVIKYSILKNIAHGKIGDKYKFFGLPFLNRPRGGMSDIIETINKI